MIPIDVSGRLAADASDNLLSVSCVLASRIRHFVCIAFSTSSVSVGESRLSEYLEFEERIICCRNLVKVHSGGGTFMFCVSYFLKVSLEQAKKTMVRMTFT